jgi:DNA-binding LytR/AlgR family response regulator
MKLRCAIIDDEPLARGCIQDYVAQTDFMEVAGTGANPIELTTLMCSQVIDLIFLDIQMPLMSGIDFLRITPNPPMVILTTAYPNYALEGFHLDVLDYLVKPVTFDRFFKAATKAKEYRNLLNQPIGAKREEYFFIKVDHKYERIDYDDILYVEAMQNYVTIHTVKGKFITLISLKSAEEKLLGYPFVRVHKSFLVAIPHIDRIEHNEIIIGTQRIAISRNFRDAVLDKVIANKLWKK